MPGIAFLNFPARHSSIEPVIDDGRRFLLATGRRFALIPTGETMKRRCPICGKIVKASAHEQPKQARFFPFCSERCKLIDLGQWFDAEYKIVSNLQSDEDNKTIENPQDTIEDG